jgi:hypothetical protein
MFFLLYARLLEVTSNLQSLHHESFRWLSECII